MGKTANYKLFLANISLDQPLDQIISLRVII